MACNGAAAAVGGGGFSCALALTPGPNAITTAVTDFAGNTRAVSRSVTYARVPLVTITSPATSSYLNISPTTINGTVDDPTAIDWLSYDAKEHTRSTL